MNHAFHTMTWRRMWATAIIAMLCMGAVAVMDAIAEMTKGCVR